MNQLIQLSLLATTLFISGCQPSSPEESRQQNSSQTPQPPSEAATNAPAPPKEAVTREFKFTYGGAISELTPGAEVSVWLPVAKDTHEQQILNREINLPGEFVIGEEAKFGNSVLHFTAVANEKGEVPFEITYHLSRQETLRNEGEDLSNEDAKLYKQGTSFVPTNKDLSATVLGGTSLKESPLVAGRQIYNAVNEYMEYDKPEGKGWGRGDSVWACGNGFGNCTDFHSLFISVCREQDIPARFEIGFSIPSERGAGTIGGYHCWAKFAADNQWIPVDISEADKEPSLTDYYYGNLTANRITFSTGRDLTLTPAQQAGPVNFLIYPYAEVAGKVHSVFRKSFLYEDIQ